MLTIAPSPPLSGTLSLPGDKSISHRVALFAALAQGESCIENFLVAGVTRAMLDVLGELEVAYRLEGSRLAVQGKGLAAWKPLPNNFPALDCGNSATTMRLMAGALAAAGIPAVLDGSAGLRSRPMDRIVRPLQEMGVPVQSTDGCAPLVFKARTTARLRSRTINLQVASAQVKSCLLLAGLAGGGPLTITEPGPSRDHTERLLGGMGVCVRREALPDGRFQAKLEPPDKPLKPLNLTLPGDFSSAAFLIVAALVTPGSDITLRGVGLNPTRTGLLEALEKMGAHLEISNRDEIQGEPVGDIRVQHSKLVGSEVRGAQVVRMIDEFPIFAVAAAFANGITTVRDARELRFKESDRIRSLCLQLQAIGVEARELDDGFRIRGGRPLRGGSVDPQKDHRLAMSLAIAGLAAEAPVRVIRPEIIRESFPGFQTALGRLGAQIDG